MYDLGVRIRDSWLSFVGLWVLRADFFSFRTKERRRRMSKRPWRGTGGPVGSAVGL